MLKPIGIVSHVTASLFGDRDQVDAWHKANGWTGIGYHKLIGNGFRHKGDAYDPSLDGHIWQGRSDDVQGAHCLAGGMNAISLGVCCVGNPGWIPDWHKPGEWPTFLKAAATDRYLVREYMTTKQHAAHVEVLAKLCDRHGINPLGRITRPDGREVYALSQHSDHDSGKPYCASLNMAIVRKAVAERLK